MAKLFRFQKLGDDIEKPKIAAISSDANTLIISTSKNLVHVYSRHGAADPFKLSNNSYRAHEKEIEITSLALQDAGVHALSGDSEGWAHVWRTDSPEHCVRKKFNTGRVTSAAISRQYILMSFFDDKSGKGCMALIRKGYNLDDPWSVVRRYDGIFSKCALSEHGKPLVPHIMYHTAEKIVYEEISMNPSDGNKSVSYPQRFPPWCMRRNGATASLLVFGILVHRELLLWAPQVPPTNENPMTFHLSSNDSLRINQSLVMSSVVSSAMFLVSIYEEEVHVIKARRIKDIEAEAKTEEDEKDKNKCPNRKKNSGASKPREEVSNSDLERGSGSFNEAPETKSGPVEQEESMRDIATGLLHDTATEERSDPIQTSNSNDLEHMSTLFNFHDKNYSRQKSFAEERDSLPYIPESPGEAVGAESAIVDKECENEERSSVSVNDDNTFNDIKIQENSIESVELKSDVQTDPERIHEVFCDSEVNKILSSDRFWSLFLLETTS